MHKSLLPLQPAYFPLEEFKFSLATGPLNTFTIDPVFADLMPNSIHYVTNSEYFVYTNQSTGLTYDSRLTGFPVPLPKRSVIDDFGGTGQILLRWFFEDFTLPMGDTLQLTFTCFIKIAPPNTFINKVYLGNPGDNVLFVYDAVPDTLDYDGDHITDEIISGVEISGAILTTSELSIKKQVMGSLDLEFGSSGATTSGSNISYELLVTNNQKIDLRDLELVDIFPYVGDTGVILTDTPRSSAFYVYPSSTMTATIINLLGAPVDPDPDITIWYSTSNNPVRFDQFGSPIGVGTWALIPLADITTLRSVKITTEPNKVGVKILPPSGASIGQFVWEDINQNGIYDNGEPGINGIVVELYDEQMNLITSTVTANNQAMVPGYYTFNNLIHGNYYVKFIVSQTCRLTQQKANVPHGSRPDPITGLTPMITLTKNEHRTDINAGLICNCIKSPYTQAVSDLISSVALEQTALAHILNAEGEKIQKAVSMNLTTKELMTANCSVEQMIHSITELELILSSKLQLFECIICESDCK